jgi:hypothetical protein
VQPVGGHAGQELLWTPARTARRTYELRAGDQVVAALVQPTWWRERRIGAAADGTWTFARAGLFHPRVVVTDAGSNLPITNMARSGWTGNGALALPDGRRFHWRSGSLPGARRTWLDEAGQPLMHFTQVGGPKTQCIVAVEPGAAMDRHLALLAMLGWYLLLLTPGEGIAAAAGSAAGA